jgi:ribonuclease HI
MASSKEPHYLFSESDAANKSAIAKAFLDQRSRLNVIVSAADNNLLKRFYNIDHNTYLEGEIPSKYKELMGLSVSAALRCDDCINYHVIQSWRLGASRIEVEETLNISLVVGGSIVIPHLRRAYDLMAQLFSGS